MGDKPLLIVVTGQTLEGLRAACGDFSDWIAAGLLAQGCPLPVQCWDARSGGSPPAPPQAWAGVVVTGSHAMVTDAEPWSEQLADWLRQCVHAQLLVLGICYGHQLLAHALGGSVGYHPQGPEVGTHLVHLEPAAHSDALFAGLPQQWSAHLVHAQSVLRLPTQAQCLARSAHEAHQAFRVGPCAWGVQFHPEFSEQAMHGYLETLAEDWAQAGRFVPALQSGVCETPQAATLLARFAALAAARQVAGPSP